MKMDELLALNSEGLIPGPEETEEVFENRVRSVREAFQKQESAIPSHRWQWAAEQLRSLYDFTPKWCSAFYSSKGLAPWQPAVTWIDVKHFYTIQLSPSRWISWLVDCDELLAHEAAHAARAAFDEPRSEEIFAYLTASARWRRVVGPLFRQPGEALVLMGLVALGACFQIIETIWDVAFLSAGCFWSASLFCMAWSFRLLRMRIRLKKAAEQLMPLLRDPTKVRADLFRLTDQEILRLAQGQTIEQMTELRWQVIRAAYFK